MIKKAGPGYLVAGEQYNLHVLFYDEGVARFAYSTENKVPDPTAAVIAGPAEIKVSVDGYCLTTDRMTIRINPDNLTVSIVDPDGTILSEDAGVAVKERKIEKKKLWETGIFGNGEKYGWLNQLAQKHANYNTDILFQVPVHHPLLEEMHTAIPFYIGAAPERAYGIYFDNSFRTEFDFAKSDPRVISFRADGGCLDYYFIYGRKVSEVVQGYCKLTGTLPLPGKQVLGYHQSRYSYETRDEVLAVAENMRRHEIPCDVLYLDIHYLEAYKVFTVDRERFSDFKGLIGKLKEMGFAVVVIVNPGVKIEEGYAVYEQGKQKGYFVTRPDGRLYEGAVWPGPAVFPDYLRSEVRQWWGEFYRELLDCGVGGIWNDMNEPSNFIDAGGTLPDDTVHRTDDGREVAHKEAHNLYGMLQTQATREALEKFQPDQRGFVLTRAAFAGSQRYAALWTGDNASIWEHLESSIPMLLNLGLSGITFSGADVGGYRGDCSGELLIRWTQLGAFYPYFRNHTEFGTARQEPWEHGPEVLDIVRRYIRLRYRFLTCFYSLMRESSLTGQPVIRPLFYHFQEDLNTYHINDQFLLGDGVMVCPVLRPGAGHRLVYLPEGTWYNYWTNQKLAGGRHLVAEAPLDTLPIYIRAGTILPQDETPSFGRGGERAKTLDVHCYKGAEGSFKLYFDDGLSGNYQRGEYSEVEVTISAGPADHGTRFVVLKDGYPIPEIKLISHGS